MASYLLEIQQSLKTKIFRESFLKFDTFGSVGCSSKILRPGFTMRSPNIKAIYQALVNREDEGFASSLPGNKRLAVGNHLLRLMIIILFTCVGYFLGQATLSRECNETYSSRKWRG